jgi:hypothetical protein
MQEVETKPHQLMELQTLVTVEIKQVLNMQILTPAVQVLSLLDMRTKGEIDAS